MKMKLLLFALLPFFASAQRRTSYVGPAPVYGPCEDRLPGLAIGQQGEVISECEWWVSNKAESCEQEYLIENCPLACGLCSEAPTGTPTATQTPSPSPVPTSAPSAAPTSGPSAAPTLMPTGAPTHTSNPTAAPTGKPTSGPTGQPTRAPSEMPTTHPSRRPTAAPSDMPTWLPTAAPTESPTNNPTSRPTEEPTQRPTDRITAQPTMPPETCVDLFEGQMLNGIPACEYYKAQGLCETLLFVYQNCPETCDECTKMPTAFPTTFPPSAPPTVSPTRSPTDPPTATPTHKPTTAPTFYPSAMPTPEPSISPSASPSRSPSAGPTMAPTQFPSTSPTGTKAPTDPTSLPTAYPTTRAVPPNRSPTVQPTLAPTSPPSTPGPTPCTSAQENDVVFLIDASGYNVEEDEWTALMSFVERVVVEFVPDNSRVAVVGYSTSAYLHFDLEEYGTTTSDRAAIGEAIAITPKNAGITNTLTGLEFVLDMMATQGQPERVKKLFLLTDGSSREDTCSIVKEMRAMDVYLTLITIGNEELSDHYNCLVNSPADHLSVEAGFGHLETLFAPVESTLCAENTAFPTALPTPHPTTAYPTLQGTEQPFSVGEEYPDTDNTPIVAALAVTGPLICFCILFAVYYMIRRTRPMCGLKESLTPKQSTPRWMRGPTPMWTKGDPSQQSIREMKFRFSTMQKENGALSEALEYVTDNESTYASEDEVRRYPSACDVEPGAPERSSALVGHRGNIV